MQDRAASRPRGRPRHPDVLTPAEWRVLEHVRAGLTNPEIAVRLGISVDTVKYHVSNMLAKLELENRRELASWQPGTRGRRMWSAGWVLAGLRHHLGGLSRATEGRRGALVLGGGAVLLAVALTIGLLLALIGDDEPSTPGLFEEESPRSGAPDEPATALPSATRQPEPTAEPKTRVLAFSNHFCWYCDGGSGRPHILEIHPDQTATVFALTLPDWLGGPRLHGWTPDGAALIVSGFSGADDNADVYRVPVERGPSGWTAGVPENLTQSPESEGWVLVDQARGRMAVRVFAEGCLPQAVDDPCDGSLHLLEPDGARGPAIAQNGLALDWSPDGRWLLYLVPLPVTGDTELLLLDTDTLESQRVPKPPGMLHWQSPAFSPDGALIAAAYNLPSEGEFPNVPADDEIAIMERSSLSLLAVVAGDGRFTNPLWRSDAELWAVAIGDPLRAVKVALPDRPGVANIVPEPVPAIDSVWEMAWSPDGQVLAAGLYRLGAFADGRMPSPVTHLSFDGGQTFVRVGIGPDADYFWRPEPDP